MTDGGAASDREFIERAVRWGITGAVVLAVLFAVLWILKGALTPLVVAWIIAYLLDPVIDAFERRRVPRGAAVLILLGIGGLAALGTALVLVPAMQRELARLSAALPGYVATIVDHVVPFVQQQLGVTLPASVREAIDSVRAGDIPIPIDAARALLERAVRAVTGTVGALVSLLIIPVLAYYLVVEFDRIHTAVLDLVPRDYQAAVSEQAARVDGLISGFIRGQLIICAALGFLYASGFSAIGIDFAFVIGAVAAVLSIIPYVGSGFAVVTASAMCLLQFGADVHLALVVGWYALVQGFEGYVLTPRVLGGSLGMHPVVVLVALMIGADLLGLLGMMIAVPVAAVAQVFVQDVVALYRQSTLYAPARGSAEGP